MNVLSLFDGMSCGQIALHRAGFDGFTYYASEIDVAAIKVTQANYPATKQLGNVIYIHGADLPNIDLLIGGSPCQGFSFAGKQLNFDHPESKLFFEFVRILQECKPDYFLLENVKMKKEYQDVISEQLGVQPIEINSALVSAQNRKRLYWTNILDHRNLPQDKNLVLRDIYDYRSEHISLDVRMAMKRPGTLAYKKAKSNIRTLDQKCKCLTIGGQCISNSGATNVELDDKTHVKLTCLECERLQTVPDNYTAFVSDRQRYKMLGNGWTVDVIAWIFSHIMWTD
jgi:site-specific DNA-cytosine methylase